MDTEDQDKCIVTRFKNDIVLKLIKKKNIITRHLTVKYLKLKTKINIYYDRFIAR